MAGFEQLRDAVGVIVFGWGAERVFYARFEGLISAELGARFAGRLTATLGQTSSVHYFADSSAVASYEVAAFKTMTAAILAKRAQFERIVARPWAGVVGKNAEAFAKALGCVEYVTDACEFYSRIRAIDPRAVDRIHAEASPVSDTRPVPASGKNPERVEDERSVGEMQQAIASLDAKRASAPVFVGPGVVQTLSEWRKGVAKRLVSRPRNRAGKTRR